MRIINLFIKNDGTWCYKIERNIRGMKCTITSPWNKIPGWYHQIEHYIERKRLINRGEFYKICGACGTGKAVYRIRNPNWKEGNTYWPCCEHCVNFYDRRWSAMKIIDWKNKKPVCKRRNG